MTAIGLPCCATDGRCILFPSTTSPTSKIPYFKLTGNRITSAFRDLCKNCSNLEQLAIVHPATAQEHWTRPKGFSALIVGFGLLNDKNNELTSVVGDFGATLPPERRQTIYLPGTSSSLQLRTQG